MVKQEELSFAAPDYPFPSEEVDSSFRHPFVEVVEAEMEAVQVGSLGHEPELEKLLESLLLGQLA